MKRKVAFALLYCLYPAAFAVVPCPECEKIQKLVAPYHLDALDVPATAPEPAAAAPTAPQLPATQVEQLLDYHQISTQILTQPKQSPAPAPQAAQQPATPAVKPPVAPAPAAPNPHAIQAAPVTHPPAQSKPVVAPSRITPVPPQPKPASAPPPPAAKPAEAAPPAASPATSSLPPRNDEDFFKLPYGQDPLQYGELTLPEGDGPYPVAVLIHGGCWSNTLANVHYMNALAKALAAMGVASWNIEYRGVDNATGGWPKTFQDVEAATDYLKTIASNYTLDLNQVIAIGHSSGGHFALWLAGRHNLPKQSALAASNPVKIKGVITLGGIPDLEAYFDQSQEVCGAGTMEKLISSKHLYAETSPLALVPLGAQQVLIYGDRDTAVPKKYAAEYLLASKYKKDDTSIVNVPDTSHQDYLQPNTPAWDALMAAIKKMVKTK